MLAEKALHKPRRQLVTNVGQALSFCRVKVSDNEERANMAFQHLFWAIPQRDASCAPRLNLLKLPDH